LWLICESSEEPDERLFELIIGFGRDIIVLEILLSVENNLFGLNLSIFDINLVSDENNWNILAHSYKILVPFGHVLVGDPRAHIEHDDTALASNIISVSETTELLLASGVPHVEKNLSFGCVEWHGVHLDTESCDVLLFELSSQMPLDECGFAYTTVSNENKFEFGSWGLRFKLLIHLEKYGYFCF